MFELPTGEEDGGTGQLFLMVCYGFILYKAATLIGDGSEKLLLLFGPGVIGGLVIPLLGAVPDGAIVLVSGLGSDAQNQVSIGVGTLAGSTIMLLTLPWALAVVLGCRDYDEKTKRAASYEDTRKPKYENGITLFRSCVTTYPNIPFCAKVMIALSTSYLIVAIPAAANKQSSNAAKAEKLPALVGLVVCAIAFVAYSMYQVWDSRSQKIVEMRQRREEFNRWQHNIASKFGKTENAIRSVFEKFDKDGNGKIDRNELYAGFQAMGLECSREQIFQIMKDMNTDEDVDTLTFEEFASAIKKWSRVLLQHKQDPIEHVIELEEKEKENNGVEKNKEKVKDKSKEKKKGKDKTKEGLQSGDAETIKTETSPLMDATTGRSEDQTYTKQKNDTLLIDELWKDNLEEEEEDDDLELHLTNQQIFLNAILLLLGGTGLCVVFSDPMVNVIDNFSKTIGIDAFYVSFIITPLASNASEIYSSLMFARKKTTESASLALSALYGASSMNSTFVLAIFCTLIYVRELKWTFLVETLVILMTILVVGIVGTRQTIFVWQACVAASMFPLSLLLVATLQGPLDD